MKIYHVLNVLNVNNGLFNGSRYYELWSIVSDLIRSQNALCAYMISCSVVSES